LIPVLEHIRGLIFDCDGTLVDSMPLHMKAWEETVQSFGANFDPEFFFPKKGMRDTDIVAQFNLQFGKSLNSADAVRVKDSFFLQHVDGVKPLRLVVDVVRRYHKVLPMAVASGGTREVVERELQVIGIAHFFDVILTGDDPFNPKPFPDLFLEAARKMGVQPSLCQVFEDGDLGLQAAENAGMPATDIRQFMQE
jgi:HAD superfamily hydrolase (TIGR01509 family)